MKKYFTALKEAWKDKRKRAFISLGLWFLFFLLVIGLSGNASSSSYTDTERKSNKNSNLVSDGTGIEKFNKMDNYEYNSTIELSLNDKTVTYVFNGTYYDKKYYFSLNNYNFYINNNKLYIVDDINKTLTLYKSSSPNNILNIYNILFMTKDSLYNIVINVSNLNKMNNKIIKLLCKINNMVNNNNGNMYICGLNNIKIINSELDVFKIGAII